MGKIYFDDCNKYHGVTTSMMLEENLGLKIFDEGEKKFIDGKELDKLLDGVINNIYDMDMIKKLGNVNIYVNVEFELDNTIYRID